MAEKNTLSILENIKKKMQKFDQEPKKIDTVSGVDDEFEYIVPAKPKEEPKQEEEENKASLEPMPQDAYVEVQNVTMENALQENLSGSEALTHDDFDLDDLSDLDHYEPKSDPLALAPNQLSQATPAKVDDLTTQEPITKVDPMPTTFNQNQKQEEYHDDDLNLNLDIDLGDHEPALQEKSEEKNPNIEPVKKQLAPIKNEDPLFDLELDDLIKHDLRNSDKDKPKPKLAEIKLTPEVDDEEFLKTLETDVAQNKKPEVEKALEVNDEEFLKNLEKDIAQNKKPEAEKALELKNKLLDDIDLKDLDNLEKDMNVAEFSKKQQATPEDEILKEEAISEEIKSIAKEVTAKKEVKNLPSFDMNQIVKKDFETAELTTAEVIKNIDIANPNPTQIQNLDEAAANIIEPKIQDWLDRNLHSLVEKIVQEEVRKLFDKR